MNEPLYKITGELQAALDAVWIDEDGILHGWDAVEAVSEEWEAKTEAVACYIKQLKADSEALQAEEDNLYKRRQSKDQKAARLTQYLAQNITAAGRDRFETARCDCRFRRTQKVIVNDVAAIPDAFMREKLIREPDKKPIKKYIESGGEVPGAELYEERKLNVK